MMRSLIAPLIIVSLLFGAFRAAALDDTRAKNEPRQADVIVYGSTPGGFCAAIAAAREGASVILLEPTDHIGGMNTGGLSLSDSFACNRKSMGGLWREWHRRIIDDYAARGITLNYALDDKEGTKWTWEPHVAMRVTLAMLEEAGVTVLAERYLQSVEKEGKTITKLITKNGIFSAKVFIDGTYEGDLMAAAGVGWTIGREGRDEYGESLAGARYPKPRMNISGFDKQGNPLAMITTTDLPEEGAGDDAIQVFSFRLVLTRDPKNRVPMPEPDHYDPARWELLRRHIQAGGGRYGFDLYPLPGDKFDGNDSIGGQFSLGLVGGAQDWCESDEAGRKKIWEAHRQYSLELFHFLTHDPSVPQNVRKRYEGMGLCKDEFEAYSHFPPALYVRQGRRLKGAYFMTEKDITQQPEKQDSIAVSSFPVDSHEVNRVALKDGGVINEGTIFATRMKGFTYGHPYQVPYRAITPKAQECDNLLVPVALSGTHVVICSVRVEPTWMVIGQSAGVAGALAAKKGVAVQEVPYPELAERLIAQGQVLDPVD